MLWDEDFLQSSLSTFRGKDHGFANFALRYLGRKKWPLSLLYQALTYPHTNAKTKPNKNQILLILLYNEHTKSHKLINPPGQVVRQGGRNRSWFCLTWKLVFFSLPGVLFFSPQKSFVSKLSALTTELFDFKVGSAF